MNFMPSLNGSRRRHFKQAASSKKSNPPTALSIISNRSSTSSNASVTTPKSIFPSSLRPSMRLGSRKDQRGQETGENNQGHTRSKGEEIPKEEVNVFAFMEREEDEVSDRSPTEDKRGPVKYDDDVEDDIPTVLIPAPDFEHGHQMSPRYSDLEVRAIHDGMQRSWGRQSLHSDSGISMHSDSPEQDSPIMQHKFPTFPKIPSIEETGPDNNDTQYNMQLSPTRHSDRGSPFLHTYWPEAGHSDRPEACHVSPPRMFMREPHNPVPYLPEIYTKPANQLIQPRSRTERSSAPSAKAGYDLLASNIGSRDDAVLKPIYRKFEMLNNRMLLYLQDEISEMEDDLRDIEDAIAEEEAELGKRPVSRRSEAKLPSQLQWHRIDLLNRSFAKVEQYNRALTSYSNLTKSLDPASHTDILAYREWICEHTPLVDPEAAFLSKEKDLLTVKPTPSQNSPKPQQANLYETPVMVVAFSLVSTIIVFKVVPRILARLVISAIVGIASAWTLTPDVPKDWRRLREWRKRISLYAVVMLVLAVVVS